MGKLKLGEITELASRTKALEDNDKILDLRISDNDVLIADNIRRIDEHGTRLDAHDAHLSTLDGSLGSFDERISQNKADISNHESRIVAVEQTKVIKGKVHVTDIPDIDFTRN